MENNLNKDVLKFLFIEECNQKYFSERDIVYRIPKGIDQNEIVNLIKALRQNKTELVFGLPTLEGNPFRYWQTHTIDRILHEIDTRGHDSKWMNVPPLISKELRIDAIIGEALYSSMIEGARTTREKANEMIRRGMSPQDRSERMTWNNYRALNYILENVNKDITRDFVNELHAILVKDTLEPQDQEFVGKYREDQRYVQDSRTGDIIYTPPSADKIDPAMNQLFSWINSDYPDIFFIHPIVKASMIHLYTVYIHPFVDGNGRISRALMYYYLLKKGYNFFQYISLSKMIAEERKAYYEAIKNVEDSVDDLTYFVLFSVNMIRKSIDAVEQEWDKTDLYNKITDEQPSLNERQKRFIKSRLKGSNVPSSIKKYMSTYKVVYETARTDLMGLVDRGIAEVSKQGREQMFKLRRTKE